MKKKFKYTFLFFICLSISQLLIAQLDGMHIIKGLPTNEVYDLMFDSKGLLWIGHDLGLSSYDGKTLKNYSNEMQSSKAVTGMIEDKQGRIWCYNFSGQIFWIKNGVMHLLEKYDANKELYFPRIAICKNELIASSAKGLFVYNLETGKAKYVSTGQAITSLVVVGNYTYAVTLTHVYSYSAADGITKVANETAIPEITGIRLMLQAQPQGDTVFAITNPESRCYRFVANGKNLRLLDILPVGSFINGVTCNGDESWVHTKTKSILLGAANEIIGYNLTDVLTDREGNRWFSSLKYGVMMKQHYNLEKMTLALPLQKGDYIRAVATIGSKFFLGTQAGDVFEQNSYTGQVKKVFSNKVAGAIEYLRAYDSSHIAICPTMGFFLLDISTQKVKQIFPAIAQIKFIDVMGDYTLLSGFVPILVPNLVKNYDSLWREKALQEYPSLYLWWGKNEFTGIESTPVFKKNIFYVVYRRCRAAVFARCNNAMLIAFKNGVMEKRPHGQLEMLLFENKPVNASGLLAYKDKVFINSVIGNVLVYDKNGLHMLMKGDRPKPENILKQFIVDDDLYILTQDGICIIDASSEQVIGYCELSGSGPGSILDIKKVKDKVLLLMNDGVYTLPLIKNDKPVQPILSLSYVVVNKNDTLPEKTPTLTHNQSNLRFHLSAPWYTNGDVVYMAYRLRGSSDSNWQYVARTDQAVYYASLPPGEYSFEAKAIHRLSNLESAVTVFQFEISKPWWQQILFQLLILVASGTIIAYLASKYYWARLRRQRLYYEKELAVEKERERISADIHDELGGTLSGIKLMTEMTERKYLKQVGVKQDLHNIHTSVSSLSQKMREVIWSLSNENNSLENLLDYLLRRGKEMFSNSTVLFHASLPEYIPNIQLKGDKRRHIYLAIKEALHNALKHADAENVYLTFAAQERMLTIEVKDDGKGFDEDKMEHVNGLKNMKIRMQQVAGDLQIFTTDGVKIIFTIPIP